MSEVNLNQRYYYQDFIECGHVFEKKYSEILEVSNIGFSEDGREILMFQVGNASNNILLTGGVHGRETLNPIVLLKMVEDYCEIYKKTENISYTIIPLINPDGYMIALRGFNVIRDEKKRLQAKKQGIPYYLWKYNAASKDLNRNFPSNTWLAKEKGDAPATEKETKALIKVMKMLPSEAYIDFHSRGNEIFYYRSQMDQQYNKTQLELAKKMSEVSSYQLAPVTKEIPQNDTGGNTVHYYSEYIRKPAFTVETVSEKISFPLPFQLQREVYTEVWEIPRIFEQK